MRGRSSATVGSVVDSEEEMETEKEVGLPFAPPERGRAGQTDIGFVFVLKIVLFFLNKENT